MCTSESEPWKLVAKEMEFLRFLKEGMKQLNSEGVMYVLENFP